MRVLPTALFLGLFTVSALAAFDAAAAKNKLRLWHQQLAGEKRPQQREALGRQMLEVTTPLVKAEPDGIAGWLLHTEAAIALKDAAACTEASAQLTRLHAEASTNPLAAPILAELKKSGLVSAGGAAAQPAAAAASSPTKILPNGDVVLNNMPAIQGDNPDLHVLIWLQQHLGWKTDVQDLLRKRKEDIDSEKFDIYKFVTVTLPQAGRIRVKTGIKFDKNAVVRELNNGRPVLVWRAATDAREAVIEKYMQQHDTDPSGTAPAPTDAAAKKTWAVWSQKAEDKGECYTETCIIFGCNEKRGEFIFFDGGEDEETNHLRLSTEELAFTTLYMFTFN